MLRREKLSLAEKRKVVELERLKEIYAARKDLLLFTIETKEDYLINWHHVRVCEILDSFERGEIKKLMIFMPPQVGKSELSSRRFPAYALGRNPNRKIALCSYSIEFSQTFNRDVQRIIDDEKYYQIFPETTLNESNVATSSKGGYKRTANIFEIVDHNGFFKTTGVGGSLTGTTVDIGIIDDPFKDRDEASSPKIRESRWNWYTDVFESRLHNESQQLILMTRWHEDDLAGKILNRDGDIANGGKWTVVKFPAIKEDNSNPFDDRDIGEALWPEKHSLERMLDIQSNMPRTFASLYQQRPAPTEGGTISKSWFRKYEFKQLVKLIREGKCTPHFYIDTALSEKEKKKNDPTGILIFAEYKNMIFLIHYHGERLGFPDLIDKIVELYGIWGIGRQSVIYIENKANGASVKQQLQRDTSYPVLLDNIKGDKMTRLELESEAIQSGRVLVPLKKQWVDPFITSIALFPNAAHDEEVDCLTGAMRMGLKQGNKSPQGYTYS